MRLYRGKNKNLVLLMNLYRMLVKSNKWSIVDASFLLVELLLGYMLWRALPGLHIYVTWLHESLLLYPVKTRAFIR